MTSSSAPQSQAKFTVVEFEYSADYPVKVELYLALHLAHIHAHTAMNGGKIVLIGPFLNNQREEKATTATGGLSIWRDATDEEITKKTTYHVSHQSLFEMTSTHELTKAQIDNLKAATGNSEEAVLGAYAAMKNKYPSGGMAEEQFLEMIRDPSSGVKSTEIDMAKLMFTIADRDKSGKVDLYEYLLTIALLCSDDPKPVLQTLFIACDANSNNFLTRDEARDIFSAFFRLMGAPADNVDQEDPSYSQEKLNSIIEQIFGDNTEITEAEFRQACIENNDVESITGELHLILLVSLTSNAKRFEEQRFSLIPRS
ncbi:unnamed protein product [Rotaria magnacalcarata]|uniref:EF-hand domain-containing protein n=2 Tax=Rotaria magnacalcarata TaxID=392030 RepID=A0A816N9H9_9BILA|nr:unnamed protein product [Rotaria magnacalcarata]